MEEMLPKVSNKNLKKKTDQMKESNFLKEFRIATTFVQNFKDFHAKFNYLKKVHPGQFCNPSQH